MANLAPIYTLVQPSRSNLTKSSPVRIKALQLVGNHRGTVATPFNFLDLLGVFPVFSKNVVDQMEFVRENPQWRLRFHQFYLSQCSKFFSIEYPDGVRVICSFLDGMIDTGKRNDGATNNVLNYKLQAVGDFELDLKTLEHAWFCARFTIRRPALEATNFTIEVSFSLTHYPRPHNRLSEFCGARNFCRVSFEYPSLDLEDLLAENASPQGTNRSTVPDAASPVTIACLLQLLGVDTEIYPAFRQIAHYIDKEVTHALIEPSRKLLENITIANISFRLIGCNIAGALANTYTYIAHYSDDQFNMAFNEVFSSPKDVIVPSKPMLLPLRVSLLNTTGIPTVALLNYHYSIVKDIMCGDQNLTDGSGELSWEAAAQIMYYYSQNWYSLSKSSVVEPISDNFLQETQQEVPDSWPSPDLPPSEFLPEGYLPSAFQVRFLGFKGMVKVSPGLKGAFQFRESMLKFASNLSPHLWIAGISAPGRSIILSSELIYLFETASSNQAALMEYLADIVIDNRRDCGGTSLKEMMTPKSKAEEIYKESHPMKREDLDKLEAGYGLLSTTHFTSRILRMNTQIPSSATLYGVADHQQVLNPDEIFLQITKSDGKCVPIVGEVIITKSPALRITDIVRFKAVRPPTFVCKIGCSVDCIHSKDIVMFSTKGQISPASLMSAADLDGDHFHIFWDPKLVRLLDRSQSAPSTLNLASHVNQFIRQESDFVLSGHDSGHARHYLNEIIQESTLDNRFKQYAEKVVLPTNTSHCKWPLLLIAPRNGIMLHCATLLQRRFISRQLRMSFGGAIVLLLAVGLTSILAWLLFFIIIIGSFTIQERRQQQQQQQLIQPNACSINWQQEFEKSIQRLSEPILSNEICSLGHLLGLRRIFVDDRKAEWGNDPICTKLSAWVNRTFEAPKHGHWVKWTEVRRELNRIIIPRYPHYHPKMPNIATKHSSSLYGQLYDKLMEQIGTECPIKCKHTLKDEMMAFSAFCEGELWSTHLKESSVRRTFTSSKFLRDKVDFIKQILLGPRKQCDALFAAVFAHNLPECFTSKWDSTLSPQALRQCNAPNTHLSIDRLREPWCLETNLGFTGNNSNPGRSLLSCIGITSEKNVNVFSWKLSLIKCCLPYVDTIQTVKRNPIWCGINGAYDRTGEFINREYHRVVSEYFVDKLNTIKISGIASDAIWRYISYLQDTCNQNLIERCVYHHKVSPCMIPAQVQDLLASRKFVPTTLETILSEWAIFADDYSWAEVKQGALIELFLGMFQFSEGGKTDATSIIKINFRTAQNLRNQAVLDVARKQYPEYLRYGYGFCAFSGPDDPALQNSLAAAVKLSRIWRDAKVFWIDDMESVILVETPKLRYSLLDYNPPEALNTHVQNILNTIAHYISTHWPLLQ